MQWDNFPDIPAAPKESQKEKKFLFCEILNVLFVLVGIFLFLVCFTTMVFHSFEPLDAGAILSSMFALGVLTGVEFSDKN